MQCERISIENKQKSGKRKFEKKWIVLKRDREVDCRERKRARKRESRKVLTVDKIDKNRELCIDLGTEKERIKKKKGPWRGRKK